MCAAHSTFQVVRVGIGNLMGAVSTVKGVAGIEGPYEAYSWAMRVTCKRGFTLQQNTYYSSSVFRVSYFRVVAARRQSALVEGFSARIMTV